MTDYATLCKGLQNFQSVRRQLNPTQTLLPVFRDEGVYHTVADIMMAESDNFSDVHGMMGMFYWFCKKFTKMCGAVFKGIWY